MFRCLKDWGRLHELIQLWILQRVKECLKIMWAHLSESWSWTRSGPFNTLMSLSTLANPPRSNSERRNGRLWNNPVKTQIESLLKCCGRIWNRRHVQENLQTCRKWRDFTREDQKCQQTSVRHYWRVMQNAHKKVISAEMGNNSFWCQGCAYFAGRILCLLIILLNEWMIEKAIFKYATFSCKTVSNRVKCLLVQLSQKPTIYTECPYFFTCL